MTGVYVKLFLTEAVNYNHNFKADWSFIDN